ncbi:MAG: acetyl-CoA carboxylase biotin carboxyl carrier protein, partial [Sphingomicrobium sp.]
MAKPKDETGSADDSAMRIDPGLVRELAELLTQNALTEIEVADGDRRIKVSREPAPILSAAPAAAPGPPAGGPRPAPSSAEGVPPPEAAPEEVAGTAIKSPMVGTAYLSAEPSAKPFVEVGEAVKAGDTLLIVEAMKV